MASASPPMLEVEDLHTYYGESYVIQGLSLCVPQGKMVAILGRNGVGKTTLVRSIVGFTPPRQGRVLLRGREITRLPSFRTTQLGVGLVPQGKRIFPSLTVVENLHVASGRGTSGRDGWTLEKVFQLFPPLRARAGHWGGKLSGGEQQMLAIGRALMGNPELLLMDEPTEGLAPLLVRGVGDTIARLKATGLSILLVEQNLPMALRVADEVHVMSRGRIVYSSSPQELWADEEVKKRFLGL
ncbi:MAG: ABC transporter ATP-binding protein [Nitrospinota bacterium]